MNPSTALKTLLLAILLLPGLADAATDTFEKRLSLDGPIVLDVDTASGSIEVRTGPGGEATIVGTIKAQQSGFWRQAANPDEMRRQIKESPPIELTGGRLRVGHLRDRSFRKLVSISYEIVVPANTEVVADTGSGSIKITGIAAPVSADTGSGSITLENIGGSVTADTGSGAIRADGVAGAFDADTGSGSVYLLQTAPGDVSVSTGSGSSELIGIVGALNADSGSGRIVVEGRQEGTWRLDTSSGSVHVDLPDDAAFNLNAESSSGRIVVDHPLTVQGEVSKKHVKGEVRGGGPLLHIDTSSGGIRVE